MSDWTPWNGGERPVPRNVHVEVRLRSGKITPPSWADEIVWAHGTWGIVDDDVVAFRIAPPARKAA